MKNKIISYLIIFTFLVFGCGDMPNDPIPGTFANSVNVILSSGKNSQQIYFNSIINFDEFSKPGNDTIRRAAFVRNAKVTVNDYIFKEVINNNYESSYYELEKPDFIQSGKEYNLMIINDKNIITGKTRVPDPFSINSHPKESTLKLTDKTLQVKITWERSLNAKGYEYQIIYPIDSLIWYEQIIHFQERSTAEITNDTSCYFNISDRQGKYVVKVGAFDENFENYYINQQYSSGVTGTYGVFCSMVVDSIVINVISNN